MDDRAVNANRGLPWENIGGGIIEARELRPRKQWVKTGCWLLCVFLMLGGLLTKYRIALLFGALYVLVLLYERRTAVTERGVEIFYRMRITTHYDFWSWEEIDAVVREDLHHPTLVALYFNRGNRVKRLFFTREESQRIMDMARRQKHRIKVAESDESRKNPAPRYYGAKTKKK